MVQAFGFRVPGSGLKVRVEIQALVFGVWGSGFEVWG